LFDEIHFCCCFLLSEWVKLWVWLKWGVRLPSIDCYWWFGYQAKVFKMASWPWRRKSLNLVLFSESVSDAGITTIFVNHHSNHISQTSQVNFMHCQTTQTWKAVFSFKLKFLVLNNSLHRPREMLKLHFAHTYPTFFSNITMSGFVFTWTCSVLEIKFSI